MLRQGSDSVIFTVSGLGIRGQGGRGTLRPSEGGMIGLLRSLTAEVRGTDVRVNGLSPGPTDTAMSREWRSPEDQAQRLASGTIGAPDDTVGTVVFLASNLSEHITGQVILKCYWD